MSTTTFPRPAPTPSAAAEVISVFRRPAFLVVLVVLLLAGVALNVLIATGKVYFQKERVPLQRDVQLLPSRLGSWVQVTEDEPLTEEMRHVLATDQYVMRCYANRDALPDPKVLDGLDKLSSVERLQLYAKLRRAYPEATIYVHMAYYTGLVDTVAHVPERCMVGGGFDPVDPSKQTLVLGNGLPPQDVKYIDFRPRDHERDGTEVPVSNVAYFFQVNGGYAWDSVGQVRMRLQDLREKYGYYCKIEMSTAGLSPEAARKTMAAFLTAALPEMEKVLPDWEAVNGRKPAGAASPSTPVAGAAVR